MSEPLPTLTTPQLAALEILLEGRTQSEAADRAAVDVRTIRRWLAQPHFRTALQQERASIAAEVHGRLQASAFRAVEALDAALLNTVDVRIRIRAAQLILQLADRALEAEARFIESLGAPTSNEPPATRNEKPDKSGHQPVANAGSELSLESLAPASEVEPRKELMSRDRAVSPPPGGAPSHLQLSDRARETTSHEQADKTGPSPRAHLPKNTTKDDIKRHRCGRFERLYLSTCSASFGSLDRAKPLKSDCAVPQIALRRRPRRWASGRGATISPGPTTQRLTPNAYSAQCISSSPSSVWR